MKKNKDLIKPVVIAAVIFIVGLVSLNIGSQIFFSRARINGYLEKSLASNSNLKVDFKKVQLSFSGSLAPFFALKMSDVSIQFQECNMDMTFKAPYLLIPFSFRKALKHDLRLGYVKAGKSELLINDSVVPCSDGSIESNSLFANLKEEQSEVSSEDENFEHFYNKVKSIFKRVSGFRIQKLDYIDTRIQKEKKIAFASLRASYNKKTESIHTYCEINFRPSHFDVPGFTSKKNINVKVKADLMRTKGLALQASARHLEGLMTIESKPQMQLNNYVAEAKVKDLPLTFLSYVVGSKSLEAINSHRIWFNSHVNFRGTNLFKKDHAKIMAKFNNLEIFGPVLKSYASNFKVQVYPKYEIPEDIDWRLDGLNLNGFIAQKNLAKISGVIDQFGDIRGSGKIKTDGQLSFEGLITESSFAFSMNRKKAQQVLKKANINLNFSKPKLNILLENIVLDQATYDGNIMGELIWKDDFEWNFSASSEVFSLSDKVQKLYAIKQSPFENLKIKIQGKKRELLSLSLSSDLETFKTKWGEFKNSKYLLNYLPEKSIYKFDVTSKSFLLDSYFFKVDFFESYKNLKNFSTTLELSGVDKSFVLSSKTLTPPLNISAEGDDYNKSFMANIKMDKTNFVLEGHINSGFEIKSVQ